VKHTGIGLLWALIAASAGCGGRPAVVHDAKQAPVQVVPIAPPPPDPLGRRACEEGGDLAACLRAGDALRDGPGVPPDRKAAAQLYARACTGGDGVACTNLGALQSGGHGVGENDALACHPAPVPAETGQDVAQD